MHCGRWRPDSFANAANDCCESVRIRTYEEGRQRSPLLSSRAVTSSILFIIRARDGQNKVMLFWTKSSDRVRLTPDSAMLCSPKIYLPDNDIYTQQSSHFLLMQLGYLTPPKNAIQ